MFFILAKTKRISKGELKVKILYVTTISNTMNTFLIPHIKFLKNQGHKVDVAFNIVQAVDSEIIKLGCKVHNINFQRSPLKKENYVAYRKLKKIITTEKYDVVHTHTPVASALVRIACRKNRNVKVIYTAHGFHFFKGAPIKNWLLYYPIERWLARYTDVLITINKEDYKRANESFKAGSIKYIPGVGMRTKNFSEVMVNKTAKRQSLGIPNDCLALLSVGELNKNKNHETIIKAMAKLNFDKIYYIICGKGILEEYLRELSKKLGLEKHIILLGYRNDIAEICKATDIFVFPSRREGLGIAAIEAMACSMPIITSNIHGIVDYSVNGVTGYTCAPLDTDSFAKNIERLLNNKDLITKFGEHNLEVAQAFDFDKTKELIKDIYKSIVVSNSQTNKHTM